MKNFKHKYILSISFCLMLIVVGVFCSGYQAVFKQQPDVRETVHTAVEPEALPVEEVEEATVDLVALEEAERELAVANAHESIIGIEYSVDYKEDEERLNNEIEFLEDYKNRLELTRISAQKKYRDAIDDIILPELTRVNEVLEKYYADRDYIILWKQRYEEYPVATKAWLFMKDLGWSDAVCAGIIGNMMTECGGHTLELQWWLYDPSGWFYGICQWHKGYYPEVQEQSLEYQLQHLADTMEQEFSMFGSNALDRFLSMTDPASAALDFAKKYERCAATEWNYVSRQNNAWTAYKYFTD